MNHRIYLETIQMRKDHLNLGQHLVKDSRLSRKRKGFYSLRKDLMIKFLSSIINSLMRDYWRSSKMTFWL